jgi:hypothetical protein
MIAENREIPGHGGIGYGQGRAPHIENRHSLRGTRAYWQYRKDELGWGERRSRGIGRGNS